MFPPSRFCLPELKWLVCRQCVPGVELFKLRGDQAQDIHQHRVKDAAFPIEDHVNRCLMAERRFINPLAHQRVVNICN